MLIAPVEEMKSTEALIGGGMNLAFDSDFSLISGGTNTNPSESCSSSFFSSFSSLFIFSSYFLGTRMLMAKLISSFLTTSLVVSSV